MVFVEGRFSVHPQYGAQDHDRVDPRRRRRASTSTTTSPRARRSRSSSSRPSLRELLATIQNPQLRRCSTASSARTRRSGRASGSRRRRSTTTRPTATGCSTTRVSVAQAVSAAAAAFPGIDRDVAVTGALLHDIGKTQAYNDDPLAIDLTDAGRLLGEIPLGYYLVRREIESIEGFDPELAQAVLHIILSHHGKLENGSPVVPATREATLVHAMDNLGGTLGSFDRIERELPDGETWSRFDRGIDSAAYFRTAPPSAEPREASRVGLRRRGCQLVEAVDARGLMRRPSALTPWMRLTAVDRDVLEPSRAGVACDRVVKRVVDLGLDVDRQSRRSRSNES